MEMGMGYGDGPLYNLAYGGGLGAAYAALDRG